MSTLFAILHVATAVFIVGPMAILPMTSMRALRAGQAGQVRTLAKSTNLFTLLSLITFILGFGLMGMYKIPFGRTWIWLSIVLYLVGFLLAMLLVVPAMRRAATALEATEPAAAPSSGYTSIAMGSGIVSLLMLAVVVLMAWKP